MVIFSVKQKATHIVSRLIRGGDFVDWKRGEGRAGCWLRPGGNLDGVMISGMLGKKE